MQGHLLHLVVLVLQASNRLQHFLILIPRTASFVCSTQISWSLKQLKRVFHS